MRTDLDPHIRAPMELDRHFHPPYRICADSMHLRHRRGAGRPPARKSTVISSGFGGLTGVADGLLVGAETF
jgi:hypothetical protein